MLALRSWRRATTATDAPGRKLSSTIRRFSSALQERRAPCIVVTGDVPAWPRRTPIVPTKPLMDTSQRHPPPGYHRRSNALALGGQHRTLTERTPFHPSLQRGRLIATALSVQ